MTDSKLASDDQLFYIVDMRRKWQRDWAVTFWRPEDAGYAYPLSWAGKYSLQQVLNGGDYYTTCLGCYLIRFAVPCRVADALAVAPPPRMIDGDAGPVVFNTPENRAKLRRAALKPALLEAQQ